MTKDALTQERLQEVVHYDPGSGEFRWRPHASLPRLRGRVGEGAVEEGSEQRAGQIAGCSMRSDYWCIHVDGCSYRAHQLAWLYMTGEWGRPLVEHRDGDPFNNRWRNLRLARSWHNASPRRCRDSDRSVFAGIALDRRSGQWTAAVSQGERVYSLGRFPTHEAAHEAYAMAARLVASP